MTETSHATEKYTSTRWLVCPLGQGSDVPRQDWSARARLLWAKDGAMPTNGFSVAAHLSVCGIPDIHSEPVKGWVSVSRAFIQDMASVGPHAAAVFLVIRYYERGDRPAFPSVSRIATWTGMSRRKVQESLRVLEKRGWIKRTGRVGASSEYKTQDPW